MRKSGPRKDPIKMREGKSTPANGVSDSFGTNVKYVYAMLRGGARQGNRMGGGGYGEGPSCKRQ